jgi:hypothetical protein
MQYTRGPRASLRVEVTSVQTKLYTVTIRRHASSTRTTSSLRKDPQAFPKLHLAPIVQFMNRHV